MASSQHAEASGNARVYQATGDQYIDEHHHHYPPESGESLFAAVLARRTAPFGGGGTLPAVPGPNSVRTPLVGRTPQVLRDRSELVDSLIRAVEGRDGGVHVLHGMGGCGKTAVAQFLFRELSQTGRRVGYWVNASEQGAFRAAMLAVAADRGATAGELVAAHGGYRAPADLVWHYLAVSDEPWLLVLDNADNPEFIREGRWLRFTPRGSVLVTTRQSYQPQWGEAELHEVGLLPPADAALVLRDLAPHAGGMAEAEAMARRLDCLPLALTLAGSFLARQTLEVWSMSDYQRNLGKDPTELIDRGAGPYLGDQQARHLVSRTWTLSLDALSRQGVPESTTLLRLLSFWSSDPLPLEVLLPEAIEECGLTAGRPSLRGDRVETALRGLLDHSLVALVHVPDGRNQERSIQTHGVLLDSVAADVPSAELSRFSAAAADLIERAIPRQSPPGSAAGRVRMLVPHAAGLLRRVADTADVTGPVELAVRLADDVYEAGDFTSAYSLAEQAAEAAAGSGAEASVLARARHAMAMAAFRLGRFPEAEALHRDALTTRRRVFGDEHPETLQSLQDLHLPLGQLQKVGECLSVLREVAAVRSRLYGERHQDTLRTRALLLEYLAVSGEVDEFHAVGAVTVSACEEELEPDAVTTVIAQHNYAFGCHTFGLPDAESAARKALTSRERVHGEKHALTLSAAVLLSWVLRDSGRLDQSINLARRVVAGQEAALGRSHPYILVNRKDLALSLAEAGVGEEALRLAEENLPYCDDVLGADDPVTVATRGLLERLRP